jgi:hypothetical protein
MQALDVAFTTYPIEQLEQLIAVQTSHKISKVVHEMHVRLSKLKANFIAVSQELQAEELQVKQFA